MKLNINIWLLFSVFLAFFVTTACNDDEDEFDSTPIVVDAVYLQDAESSVPDRKVEFVRLGQILRIEGSGFSGMRKVYVNGYNTYFNPVYVSNTSMLIQISRDTPTVEADENMRNTIKFEKLKTDVVYPFEVRDASPSVTSISHTLPQAGEPITIYGSGLIEIARVVFPGNVEVSEGIISDEEGEFCVVTVPEGLSESGSVFVEGANGGAYSPSYFNFVEGVILNFDGLGQQGFWGWSETGSMIDDSDLKSEAIGVGNVSQGNYVPHRPERLGELDPAANRRSEVWTAGNDVDDWRGQLTEFIPASTPVGEFAFQFDVFVPNEWVNTGFLKILLYNSFNGGEWDGNVYNYVPWIVDNEVVPFKTEGWQTVTVPFNEFYGFSDADAEYTFEDVLMARESTSWKNFGMYFENSDFKLSNLTGNSADEGVEFPSSATSVDVYTDNWRIVPFTTPTYSDFPDEEVEAVE